MSTSQPVVIVTGSAGLLGRPVCRSLVDAGYRVFGFDQTDLPRDLEQHPQVRGITFDITDRESIRSGLVTVREQGGRKLASVVHLAAYYDFSGEESELYQHVTIDGTKRILDELADFEMEQFLFTSTMLVHQPCEVGQSISEDDPLEAKWPYPQSKIETERLIREEYPALRSLFLRLAGVYTDEGRQPTLVQQIKRIYEKDFQSYFYPGDTSAGQSAVHLDDAVEAIIRSVDRRHTIPPQTAILIGESEPVAYETLQDEIGQRIHGREWSTVYVPKALAKIGAVVSDTLSGGDAFIKPFMVAMADDHYALDLTRAKVLLDWQPRHRLRNDLPQIIDALKRDPDHWYEVNGLERP